MSPQISQQLKNLIAEVRSKLQDLQYDSADECVDKFDDGPLKLLWQAEVLNARSSDPRMNNQVRRQFAANALARAVACFLSPQSIEESPEFTAQLSDLLTSASAISGIPLYAELQANRPKSDRGDNLVREFYFGRTFNECSAGLLALRAKEKLKNKIVQQSKLGPSSYSIEFLKRFSSYTPLLSSLDPTRVGGGYFVSFGNYGCVIDPGHHYLDNFFKGNHSIVDVQGVIVTHFHDDHYADLPALISLLHQGNNQRLTSKIDFFMDKMTSQMFQPLIEPSPICGRRVPLLPNMKEPIVITNGVKLRTIPAIHPVFGENSGVGLLFDIEQKQSRLIITGDTGWNNEMEEIYRSFRHPRIVLVAHISTVLREEVFGVLFGETPGFYSKHLGIRGLGRIISAVHPAHVVLSEIGEELRGSVDILARIIERLFPCNCSVGWPENPIYFPVEISRWDREV